LTGRKAPDLPEFGRKKTGPWKARQLDVLCEFSAPGKKVCPNPAFLGEEPNRFTQMTYMYNINGTYNI